MKPFIVIAVAVLVVLYSFLFINFFVNKKNSNSKKLQACPINMTLNQNGKCVPVSSSPAPATKISFSTKIGKIDSVIPLYPSSIIEVMAKDSVVFVKTNNGKRKYFTNDSVGRRLVETFMLKHNLHH